MSFLLSLFGGSSIPLAVGGIAAAAFGYLWLRVNYFKSKYNKLKVDYATLNKVYQENLRVYESVSKQYKASILLLKQASDRDSTNIDKQRKRKDLESKSNKPVASLDTVPKDLANDINDILKK